MCEGEGVWVRRGVRVRVCVWKGGGVSGCARVCVHGCLRGREGGGGEGVWSQLNEVKQCMKFSQNYLGTL